MSACGCSGQYEEGADGYAEFWREGRVQKSRKQFRCSECGDLIPPGSRYCFALGAFDGCFDRWFRCLTCAALAELIATMHGLCPLWGGLRDSVEGYGDIDWHEFRAKARHSESSFETTTTEAP